MEVYAAMLTNLDDNVGRVIDYLKSIGEYDNTMIVFFSDNGADGMGYGFIPFIDSNLNLDIDNSLANYGRQGSFIRSEEPTSELQSLMRISYAVFCLKKKNTYKNRLENTIKISH